MHKYFHLPQIYSELFSWKQTSVLSFIDSGGGRELMHLWTASVTIGSATVHSETENTGSMHFTWKLKALIE